MVDSFRGMKQRHIKWNENVSCHFKRDTTNVASKT